MFVFKHFVLVHTTCSSFCLLFSLSQECGTFDPHVSVQSVEQLFHFAALHFWLSMAL